MKPFFSLIIPAFNCRASLALLLRCLEAQTLPPEQFECLIVDDGSKDDSGEIATAYRGKLNVRGITHPINRGRSHARNTGWRQSESEIVIFLDADVLPAPQWLEKYQAAWSLGQSDVISGKRYYVDVSSAAGNPSTLLADWAQTTPEELFGSRASEHFAALHAWARLGPYPNQVAETFEAQVPQVCERYPESLVCAYSFVTANVSVRREWLEQSGGFDPSMGRGEDTELGVRLWELGARFGFAPGAQTYHLYEGTHGLTNSLGEHLAFFYRHPYRMVLLLNLWFAYHSQTPPQVPHPLFENLLTLAGAGKEIAEFDLAAEFYRIYKQPIPADCIYDQTFMIEHYHEQLGLARKDASAYLDEVVKRGVITACQNGKACFDLAHTTNWLMKRTPFQQYDLEHGRYRWFREWLPAPENGHAPLTLECQGTYEVYIPETALRVLGESSGLTIPLPVEHACQTEVTLTNCDPPDLLHYADPQRRLLERVPLKPDARGEVTLRYEFTCRVHEPNETLQPTEAPGRLSAYLTPTYPPKQLAKANELLKKIVVTPVDDVEALARQIYQWILDNVLYLQSYLSDFLVLETGFGPCVHLTRLFVNLCRLMRIPAREQCGVTMGRVADPAFPRRTELRGRGYSLFTHTWAEFYTPTRGWTPLDLTIAYCLGRRILTPLNVRDERLRAQLIAETPGYDDYYFGHVDPFRVYTDERANKVPTFPVARTEAGWKSLGAVIAQTRHSLVCEFNPIQDPKDPRRETFRV